MIELLFFKGKNCGVCHVLKPKLIEEVAQNFHDLKITEVDVEEEKEFSAQYLVFTLPVVILLNEGKEVKRFVRSFGVNQVMQAIDQFQES